MSVSEISKKWTMPVRDSGLSCLISANNSLPSARCKKAEGYLFWVAGLLGGYAVGDSVPKPLGFIRWKIPVKFEKQRIAPLLFTVYLADASGRSPTLPCLAEFFVLVHFSGLFAFTQLFFQTLIWYIG